MPVFLRRLTSLLQRRRIERELADELQFHREMAERDLRQSRVPDSGVNHAVNRMLGNVTLAREDAGAVWGFPWLESLWQDIRHAARSLRRSPGLVVVSALSLGLGIGVNTLIFEAVNLIYGHEPTMTESKRVVGVEPGNSRQFSYPNYQDLVRAGIFSDALGFRIALVNQRSDTGVWPVNVLAVTPNFFEVLGVQPRLGRMFSSADEVEREPRVVVVTHAFWQRRGADPSLIGQSITLNNEAFSIVGVLPEDYRPVTGWMGPTFYVPVSKSVLPAIAERGTPSLTVLARLMPDGSAADAQRAVTALGAALEQAYPEWNEGMQRPASVFPADTAQFRGTPAAFFLVGGLLWASVGLVLVIAAVNVAGILLARSAYRRSEIGIRMALGAGRRRLMQTLLVESLLLVSIGAVVGLSLAFALSQVPWASAMTPFQGVVKLDAKLVLFALGLILVTTAFCGVVPAFKATRSDVLTEVRQAGHGWTPRLFLRHALVVGQIAMSLALIVIALLCVRSQIYVRSADPGFDLDHGVVARFNLDESQYPGSSRQQFVDRVVTLLGQLPGVTSASEADLVPLGGDALIRSFHPAGQTDIPGTRPLAYSVGPRYFATLSIPFVRGRDFDGSHAAGAPSVAIVNETYARTHFPDQDVIGKRVQTGGERNAEIIGLVRDSRIDTIGEAPQSVVYYPFAQRTGRLFVHLRTAGSPDAMVSTVWRALEDLDRTVPIQVQTLRSAASLELTMRQTGTLLVGSIGVLGLLLTVIGLYGVMAYMVASRTSEIAIRMALGASAGRVRREVLGSVLGLVLTGVVIGGAAVLGVTPALRTFLVGVGPFDPVAFGAAALLLAFVGLLAGAVPAVRGSRIDPMRALHTL